MHLWDVPRKLTGGMSTLNEWEDVVVQGEGLCAPFFIFGVSLQQDQSFLQH